MLYVTYSGPDRNPIEIDTMEEKWDPGLMSHSVAECDKTQQKNKMLYSGLKIKPLKIKQRGYLVFG